LKARDHRLRTAAAKGRRRGEANGFVYVDDGKRKQDPKVYRVLGYSTALLTESVICFASRRSTPFQLVPVVGQQLPLFLGETP
jgi:hypothetical protein